MVICDSESLRWAHVHCVQKQNTHSHFLSYLHEWCMDLNKNKHLKQAVSHPSTVWCSNQSTHFEKNVLHGRWVAGHEKSRSNKYKLYKLWHFNSSVTKYYSCWRMLRNWLLLIVSRWIMLWNKDVFCLEVLIYKRLQMWRHNDIISRSEYLISTLSESTVP